MLVPCRLNLSLSDELGSSQQHRLYNGTTRQTCLVNPPYGADDISFTIDSPSLVLNTTRVTMSWAASTEDFPHPSLAAYLSK